MQALPSKDRESFQLSIKNLAWGDYMEHFCEGLRPMLQPDGEPPKPTEIVKAKSRLNAIMYVDTWSPPTARPAIELAVVPLPKGTRCSLPPCRGHACLGSRHLGCHGGAHPTDVFF